MNDTKYLNARHHCQEIMEAVIVDYWTQGTAAHSDFQMNNAHAAFVSLADVLGYTVTRIAEKETAE